MPRRKKSSPPFAASGVTTPSEFCNPIYLWWEPATCTAHFPCTSLPWRHDPQVVAWLLAHDTPVDAQDGEGKSPLDYAAISAGWSANDHYFPYLYNARIEPAKFYEVVQLLRSQGARLTPTCAVAIGDRDTVLQMDPRRATDERHQFLGRWTLDDCRASQLHRHGFAPAGPGARPRRGRHSHGRWR